MPHSFHYTVVGRVQGEWSFFPHISHCWHSSAHDKNMIHDGLARLVRSIVRLSFVHYKKTRAHPMYLPTHTIPAVSDMRHDGTLVGTLQEYSSASPRSRSHEIWRCEATCEMNLYAWIEFSWSGFCENNDLYLDDHISRDHSSSLHPFLSHGTPSHIL